MNLESYEPMNLVLSSGASLPKGDVFARYGAWAEESVEGGVTEAVLGKSIKELFPSVSTRRLGPRDAATNHFSGLQWVEAVLLQQQQQKNQQQREWGAELAALRMTVPTLRRCPRGARAEVARALAQALTAVTSSGTEDDWGRLFLLPYLVLAVPSAADKVKNLTSWVKSSVAAWFADPTVSPKSRPPQSHVRNRPPSDDVSKKVEAKLADGDIRGAIRLVSSDDVVAPPTQETVDALLEKHPPHPQPSLFPEAPESAPPLPVSIEEVESATKSFPPGSAGGLDALRPQILKDLLGAQVGVASEKLAEAIKVFADLVLSGGVPAPFRRVFFGAALTALRKKTGGIRPIAVGNTWRRLIAKIVCGRIHGSLVEKFTPHQLGVGIRGGAEAGAHAARVYFNAHHDSIKAFLKVDFRNAFNEVRRDTVLSAVKVSTPEFFEFVASAYDTPSDLFFGDKRIASLLGVQQGDPLGPALFALAIQPIVQAMETELNIWFLDDGTVGDGPEKVLVAFDLIRRMGAEAGLFLNEEKCEVAFLGGDAMARDQALILFRQAAPAIQIIGEANAVLLGGPLTDVAASSVVAAKTAKLVTLSSRLGALSTHSAFFLLRASISVPRLIYFLRCAPTWRRSLELGVYDEALKAALESILNVSLSPGGWIQSGLPVRSGGLGVRHAVDVAIPCFLASFHSVLPLVESLLPSDLLAQDAALEEAEVMWTLGGVRELPPMEKRSLQGVWEEAEIARLVGLLNLAAETTADKARLLACAAPKSGAWLQALPSPQLGTLLSDEQFRVAAALRLGADVCVPHVCPCGAEVSALGHHGLSCRRSAGRLSRHESANDVILRALHSAGVPSLREPAGCSTSDGKRPDGMTLVPWKRGRSLVWDFTCTDTLAASYVFSTAVSVGAAALEAEERKKKKYSFLEGRFLFVPVALETFGVWGREGLSFIKEVGGRIAEFTQDRRATNFLVQRLSVALQRGNVASVLGTLPAGRELDELFLL